MPPPAPSGSDGPADDPLRPSGADGPRGPHAASWRDDPAWIVLHGDGAPDDLPDLAPPIRPSTTFRVAEEDRVRDGPRYRRTDDPTVARLERLLGGLDGGEAVAFASGMAAVTATIHALRPERILLPEEVYHGVREAAAAWIEESGAALEVLPSPVPSRLDGVAPGDLLWLETPSNPRLYLADVARSVAAAHEVGASVVVDATIATPILTRPLAAGADVVVHATTKFINGHSDAMGGVAVTRRPAVAASLRALRRHGGAVMGTFDAWLTLRGVRTLVMRIERQGATARRLAEALAGDASETGPVRRVWHPSLPDHPSHGSAAVAGPVPLLSVTFADDDLARRVQDAVTVFRPATSFGGVESTLEHRRGSDPDAPAGLVRIAPGLEPVDMLLADLRHAIDVAVGARGPTGPA